MTSLHLRPEEIEAESFRIIDAEAGEHSFPADEWTVVRRMIHTAADFDYVRNAVFSPEAVVRGIEAIRSGRGIVTDTGMAMAGIRRKEAAASGCRLSCHVADPDVAREAQEHGITRSVAAMRKGAGDAGNGIFVIGNAPTALFELLRLVREKIVRPDLVIGLPVGFVGAVESKEELLETCPRFGVPFITARGRKGGSNIAAAATNALLILAAAQRRKDE
jgi:precorrin-8X/cobalt-precorrin-8 methylmutase